MPTITDIIARVSKLTGVPVAAMKGNRRTAEVADARQLAMYLAYKRGGHSRDRIAFEFDREPETVGHACRAIEKRRERAMRLAKVLENAQAIVGKEANGNRNH